MIERAFYITIIILGVFNGGKLSSSKIEWTDTTWNPTTGCTKISPGCQNCYAERFSKRLRAMGTEKYKNGFHVTTHEDILDLPLKWKNPKFVFVDSMSDLFHEDIPLDFINQVFHTMGKANQHIFQILTKRSERMHDLSGKLNWHKNIWLGVSVENDAFTYRIDHLRRTEANIKFISFEPLIGPIVDLNLRGIDWVIVGGESGSGSRVIKKEWVESIKDICTKEEVPFFFKQWGGINKKKNGRKLNGRIWEEMPLRA